MVKVVVLGAGGQLGHDLCLRWPGEVTALKRSQADLTQPEALRAVLSQLSPQLVVNCAAYNFVDRAESEAEAAFAVNAWGVRHLALICRELDSTLVHFSTDYVFGLEENRTVPWTENEAPGPVSVYGLSKLTGEYWVRALVRRHFVIRTCGLYGVWGAGGKGTNFVETMLRLAQQGQALRVVADQRCTPTYTVDLAQAAAALVATDCYGLYHLTNGGSCSWHEFARAIVAGAKLAAAVQAISSMEFAARARRPAFSVLDNSRYVQQGLAPLRPWPEALAAYLLERRLS